MEGIKKKILIVFLIAIALVLGYQAYTMAMGEIFTKPAGAAVPFPVGNFMIYCREHHNGWGYHGSVTSEAVDYRCEAEINTDEKEAYGFAYLLGKGSTWEVQNWIWAHSGQANGQYILNPSTDFKQYFTGYSGNNTTVDASISDEAEITPIKLIDCLTDPTINVIDQVPYLFFEKTGVGDETDDEHKENLITDISYVEYNYLYQLQYLFGHMSNIKKEDRTVENLKTHMGNYASDGMGSVYYDSNKSDKKITSLQDIVDNETNGVLNEKAKNKYGEEIDIYTCTLGDNRKVVFWSYSNNKNADGTYKRIYHIEQDNKSGTSKFDARVLFRDANFIDENGNISFNPSDDDKILERYINIYNNNNFSDLKELLKNKGYEDLANKLNTTNGDNIFDRLNNAYIDENKKIEEIAENDNTDLEETGDVTIYTDEGNMNFNFSGNVYQAAKIYQWLRTDNRLEKYAEKFKVNTNDAKVSIDVENGKYIIGPFSMNYATVILNDEILLGLVDGTDKSCFDVNLDGVVLERNQYRIVKNNDEGKVPASGETFYIELNKDIKKDIKGNDYIEGEDDFLNKNDKITFTVRYTYVSSICSTIHFLKGIDDEDNQAVFNTNHPQRLMTHGTTIKYDIIEKEGAVTPDYYDFVIEKFEAGTDHKLDGAKFAALARYIPESGYGSNIYLDLESQKSGYKAIEGDYNGENGTYTALNNDAVKGKYETVDGKITISNVPDKVTYDGTTYILHSVVAKETEAPEGFILNEEHFEIIKSKDIEEATAKRENEREKPYEIKARKVNEKGEPISGLTFKYWFINPRGEGENEKDGVFGMSYSKTATTNQEGIATFESKAQGDLIALVAKEVPDDKTKEYKYFQCIIILYSTKTDKDGNITLKFFDTANEDERNLWEKISFGNISSSYAKTIQNGVYSITPKEGEPFFGIDANKYIKCGSEAGENVDIQITNEKIKPYNLELYKYDENGKISEYLDGTEFEVTIAKQYQSAYKDTVTVKNGIAKIEDLNIYGENLYLYLKEKPKQGFKTDLYNDKDGKGRMVLIYSADESGNIKIKYKNESVLNPTQSKIENYESATVVEGENGNIISLRLGIINESEDYAIKFRKVDENGNPLKDVTFDLVEVEKDAEGNEVDNIIATKSTDSDGYMTFSRLTLTSKDENDVITLFLKEVSSAPGYEFSNSDLKIEYKYIPGSNVLKDVKITKVSGDTVLREQAELQIEKTENAENNNEKQDIIFNFRELNEIFEIVNTPNPYDLELFTKVDENNQPIANLKFDVLIYKIDKDENGKPIFARFKDEAGEIQNASGITLESSSEEGKEGKVILNNVLDYGTFYVEVIETSESDKYETIKERLRFSYTIAPGKKIQWGNTLEILDENGNVVKTYTRDNDNATKFQTEDKLESYDNVKIDNDELYVINNNKPYNLIINKVNGLTGKPIEGIEFSAIVFKNLTSEKQTFTGTTDKDGNIILEGINIYSTPHDVEDNRERLTVVITENVPEGYKWHEYGKVTYTIDYKKFSATEPIENLGGIITARIQDENGEPAIKFLDQNANIEITESTNGTQGESIKIENMPLYDLKIFDKKVERKGNTENEIKGGIDFTAKVVNSNGETLQENVTVTFDENGIIARDIDTCKEFINEDGTIKEKVDGLKLILTEVENNKYDKIDDITVEYNCTYNNETDKFETTKTHFEYQRKSYEIKDAKDLIDGLIYVVDGKAVLVNKPKSTELAIRKVDEKGNPVAGVKFTGKVYKAGDESPCLEFEEITGDKTTVEGLAVIGNIEVTGEVKVVIEEEKWANEYIKEQFHYSELEFMKEIEISGIVINEDEMGNRTVDYTNAVVDDTHKEQVKINNTTMEIEVTNKFLTYNIPIVKTTDLLSNNENAEKLPNVMFNVSIKNVGEGPAMTQVFNNVTTDSNGELVLSGINKFGDVVLTLEETVGAPNTKMLEHPVDIEYNATIDENGEVKLEFAEGTYDNGKIEYMKELGILNVVNTRDYSITIHKKLNVDGTNQELNDGEEVKFKGIVTTNSDIAIGENDKKVSELTYDEFVNNISSIQNLASESVIYFEEETEKGLCEISKLNFYKQPVYVYFIETDVPASMTKIEEVIKVTFTQEDEKVESKGAYPADKVSVNTENKLDIQIDVSNPASSYKVNLIKVDKNTKEKVALKNAKFKVILKELDGESVKLIDEAIISFTSTGSIDKANSKSGSYIVGMDLVDGYIQLDVNKYGTLKLEITEESAPKHYEKYIDTMIVKYTAKPGEIPKKDVEVTGVSSKDDVKAEVNTNNNLILDITIPNNPEPYDLTIKKVVKQNVESEDSTAANDIKFDVNFFKTDGERTMKDKTAIYNVQNGKFTVEDIETFGEYYMTLEEYDVPDDIVKLDGIHVFKIKATPKDIVDEKTGMVISEDVVKEITYEGTAKIENDKLTINNDKSDGKYFDLKDGNIARLEITNIPVKQYYLDLTKVVADENGNIMKDDEGKPKTLSDVEFSLYLTKSDENYQTGENLLNNILDKTSGIKTNKDGKIAIGALKYVGEYKLTVKEDKAPKEYKKTFNIIEVIYYTKDGENLEVRSIKVDGNEVKDKDTTAVEYGEGTNGGFVSIEFTMKNIEKKPVPLSIHKVYYLPDGTKKSLPVVGAIFNGVVREVETGYEYPFTDVETDKNGMASLGEFKVDGKVEVEITEVFAPAEVRKIDPTTIIITVNNDTKKVVEANYTCDTNVLEGIKDNVFEIVDPSDIPTEITLAGLVWQDIKDESKGEDSYTGEGYTEGLYDEGYDKLVQGIVVRLYKKGSDYTPVATYTTGADGTYVFSGLNPFEQYYITFDYNGTDYEAVKYLVKENNNGIETYESISKAIDNKNWDINSKAVTDKDNENLATTTATQEAISKDSRGNIQYYPAYNRFTIDNDGITLYIKDGKYYTELVNGSTGVEFKPLQPAHSHINFGIKEKPTFDLRLSKDVEYIKVKLDNGTSMEYKYGIKPDSSMYKLEISKADIKKIGNMEIVYKITVTNEDLSDGTLNSISDYYDFDMLEFAGWSYNRNGDFEGKATNKLEDTDTKKIIPKQTYNSTESKLSKDNEANTEYVRIDEEIYIESGKSVEIYVKYKYKDTLINDLKKEASIGDEFVTLGVAEINQSKSNSGRPDKDSTGDNLRSKFNNFGQFYENNGEYLYYTKLNSDIKEDDEDAAPAAKIVVGNNNRTISGNVFEDLNKDGILTEGTASDNDTLIKGIKVDLIDCSSGSIVATTDTNENGYYEFTNVSAGEYIVQFTYGDENTVLPIIKNSDGTVSESNTVGEYKRLNDKSYNALEFESTDYNPNDYLEDDGNGNKFHKDYWYADPTVVEKSNAYDISDMDGDGYDDPNIEGTRPHADIKLNETTGTTAYGIMNNKQAELLYAYKGDTTRTEVLNYIEKLADHYVIAQTQKFKVNMENTTDTEVQYNNETENGTVIYGDNIIANTSLANNIDFGIKERNQSNIKVEKVVENVKIYKSNGELTVDVSLDKNGKPIGEASRVQWSNGDNGKGYIWIQRSDEEITGAKLEITYKITVKNEARENITVRVADYVQDGVTYTEANNLDENKKPIWKIATAKTEFEGEKITSSKVGNVEINNTIDLTNVSTVLVKNIELNNENESNYTSDVKLVLTKTLNSYSDTDIDAYTNYVEIIQTESEGLAKKDSDSIPGNYDPIKQKTVEGNLGRIVTTTDVNGLEKDSSKALETISITGETGENRATYYILTFAIIAVFATGVVLIKKYAIKK